MSGYLPPLTSSYLDNLSDAYIVARENNGVAVIVNSIYNNVLHAARTGNKNLNISLSQYETAYMPDAYIAIQGVLTTANGFTYIQEPLLTNGYTLIMSWT